MQGIWLITKLTLRLLLRRGAVAGMLVLSLLISVGIFWAASGDGSLISELQLRTQYAYSFSYTLIILMVLLIAPLVIRSQIEEKQLHMLDSRPVSRAQMWLGKWIGVSILGLMVVIANVLALFVCSWMMSRSYSPEERQAMLTHYQIAEQEVLPVAVDWATLTRRRFDQRVEAGIFNKADADEKWEAMLAEVRREYQGLPANSSLTRTFDLKGRPAGDSLSLKYRFMGSPSRKTRLEGKFIIRAIGGAGTHEVPFDGFAQRFNTIEDIPTSIIPADGRVEVEIVNDSGHSLVLPHGTALRLFVQDCGLYANLLRIVALHALHLAIVASIGVTAGVAFTFPVAAFTSTFLFLVSVFSGLFAQVASDLKNAYDVTILDQIAVLILQIGLALGKGVQLPPVITPASYGLAVPVGSVMMTWGVGALLYCIVAVAFGIRLLNRKELDRLH